MSNAIPACSCAVPSVHVQPWRGPGKCPLLTTHSSAGWPVASSHAPLASSRTPSRSVPVTASPSGRSEAGPSLVRDERSRPSLPHISEHGLGPGSVTPPSCMPSPSSGRREAVLPESKDNYGTGCAGLLLPWLIKVYLLMELCGFGVPLSVNGLGEHRSSVHTPGGPAPGFGAKQNWIQSTHLLRAASCSSGSQ